MSDDFTLKLECRYDEAIIEISKDDFKKEYRLDMETWSDDAMKNMAFNIIMEDVGLSYQKYLSEK